MRAPKNPIISKKCKIIYMHNTHIFNHLKNILNLFRLCPDFFYYFLIYRQ
jgi:hypothetical protein